VYFALYKFWDLTKDSNELETKKMMRLFASNNSNKKLLRVLMPVEVQELHALPVMPIMGIS
jgi:hypothetical protein